MGKPVAKPKPPFAADVDADLQAALSHFGAELSSTQDNATRLFDYYVRYWTEHKKPPRIDQAAKQLNMNTNTARNMVAVLVNDDRMLKVRRGVYVPKV